MEVEGSLVWVVAGDTTVPSHRQHGVRLLPCFDAYVVGSQPRDLLFPGRAAQRALIPSGQAGNYPVFLVDGIVAGVWHQRRSGRWLDVTVEPFGRLDAPPGLTIGTISAGAHA